MVKGWGLAQTVISPFFAWSSGCFLLKGRLLHQISQCECRALRTHALLCREKLRNLCPTRSLKDPGLEQRDINSLRLTDFTVIQISIPQEALSFNRALLYTSPLSLSSLSVAFLSHWAQKSFIQLHFGQFNILVCLTQ